MEADIAACVILQNAHVYAYYSIRRRCAMHRNALTSPNQSSWRFFFENADDSSFVSLLGLNRHVFMRLHQILFHRDARNNSDGGRPRSLNSIDELGLILHFLNSPMQHKYIMIIFGATPAVVSRSINDMLKRIVKKLRKHALTEIKLPDEEKTKELVELIRQRSLVYNHGAYPITDAFGFMDGLCLPVSCSTEVEEQNAYYNGWHSATTINNILVWSPEGKCIYAAINFPGSWHDSTISKSLYETMEGSRYKLLADSGFKSQPFLYRPIRVRSEAAQR
jgi:hypothetical protein